MRCAIAATEIAQVEHRGRRPTPRDPAAGSTPPVPSGPLAMMQERARRFGRLPALAPASGTFQLTYRGLARYSLLLSSVLMERGHGRRQNVAILSESCPEWSIAFFASLRSGATVVPLDVNLTIPELGAIVQDAKPRLLFASARCLDTARRLQEVLAGSVEVMSLGRADGGPYPCILDLRPERIQRHCERRSSEAAVITYTSGTTGAPKGVVTSFGNLMFQATRLGALLHLRAGDVFLSMLGLNHLLELSGGLLSVLYSGAQICYVGSLVPNEFVKLMQRCKPTHILTVPLFLDMLERGVTQEVARRGRLQRAAAKAAATLARGLAATPAPRLLFRRIHASFGGRLQAFIVGGAPVAAEVEGFWTRVGVPVYQGYGLSETGPVISVNTPDRHRKRSVGRPIPGIEVRIVPVENCGQGGEIQTRGPHVMNGYYMRPDLTSEVVDADGWLHTGDLGYLDAAGFLYITGRIKNLVVLPGGKKVHPEEVETALQRTPRFEEACVVGVRVAGVEKVCAVVVPARALLEAAKLDVGQVHVAIHEEVAALCRDLAPYKRPSLVRIHDGPLPRTTTRKVKRRVLAEWAETHANPSTEVAARMRGRVAEPTGEP